MPKRNHVSKSQHNRIHLTEARSESIVKPLSGQVDLRDLLNGTRNIAGGGILQRQAACVSDFRLLTTQQQTLAAQIGRVQGNRHLQRVVALLKPDERVTGTTIESRQDQVGQSHLPQIPVQRQEEGTESEPAPEPEAEATPESEAEAEAGPAPEPEAEAAPEAGAEPAEGGGAVSVEEAANFIEQWEGRRQAVYTDTEANRTVGVGFNLERAGARERIEAVGANFDDVLNGEQTLTDEQIDQLLQQDVEDAMDEARNLVGNFDNLPEDAQRIVVDMVFNLGATGFEGFANTRQALEERDFATAADEMEDSQWYDQVGNRSEHHVETMRGLATGGE
jgi:GH24 family phage-related lysozyme (muramidase)